jgi:hypothetical protein
VVDVDVKGQSPVHRWLGHDTACGLIQTGRAIAPNSSRFTSSPSLVGVTCEGCIGATPADLSPATVEAWLDA